MKFNKLRFVGVANVDLPIIGVDPENKFILKAADGLGPPEIDVRRGTSSMEGSVRQGRRASDRQIVARVGLQPLWDEGQTPEALRTELYGLLTPKYGLPVGAHIMLDDTVLATAQGDISKFEVALFERDPEVQITLDCDHAYLFAPEVTYQVPVDTEAGSQTLWTVENAGTAPSGFWVSIQFTDAVAGPITISDASTSGQVMRIAGAWATGDKLTIDTRPGSRGVWKTPAGAAKKSILDDLTGDSIWLMLHHGTNTLRFNFTAYDWLSPGFAHTAAYWGV